MVLFFFFFIVVLFEVGTDFSSLVLDEAGLIQQGEADLYFWVELVETFWSNVTVAENLCCIQQQSNTRWKLGGHLKGKMTYVSECRMHSSAAIQHLALEKPFENSYGVQVVTRTVSEDYQKIDSFRNRLSSVALNFLKHIPCLKYNLGVCIPREPGLA